MNIVFDEDKRQYTFTEVSETELQVFHEAFLRRLPFSDVPVLRRFAGDVWHQLEEAKDALLARYKDKEPQC